MVKFMLCMFNHNKKIDKISKKKLKITKKWWLMGSRGASLSALASMRERKAR